MKTQRMPSIVEDLERHDAERLGRSSGIARQEVPPVVSKLIWEDPPAARGGKRRPPPYLEELRAHPGRWARVLTNNKSSGPAETMRKKYGLEAVTRRNVAGGFDIYARSKGAGVRG